MTLKGARDTAFIICWSKMGRVGRIAYHNFIYKRERGKKPDFKNPKDLSERILAKTHTDEYLKYVDYADKVKVRDYIKSKGLEDILLEYYGSWKKAEDIDFASLPEKFALKPNNGCGGHVFCKDISTLDIKAAQKRLNDALKLKKIGFAFEPHYSRIEPRIYCEQLIDTGSEEWPVDYKFTCINGKVEDIFVAVERRTKTKYITYDKDWNILPYTRESYLPKTLPPKPKHLDRMIEIAEILSADFDIVRVDLYEWNDKVYFSELTFTPWGGFMYSYTNEAIKVLGEKVGNRS